MGEVGNLLSNWGHQLNGGMPQVAPFGPNVLLTVIRDLKTDVREMQLYKFVDNTTAVEAVDTANQSNKFLVKYVTSTLVSTKLFDGDYKKTKEMIIRNRRFPDAAYIYHHQSHVKALCETAGGMIHVTANLCMADVPYRLHLFRGKQTNLYFLKLVKRSSFSATDLILYYEAIIHPVMENACPVWQSGLASEQHDCFESFQRHAM